MNFIDVLQSVKPVGGILIIKYDADGNMVSEQLVPNTITRVGKQRLASHAANDATSNYWFSHIALGDDGDTAASEDDTSLTSEIYREAFDSVFADGTTVFGQSEILASDIGGSSYTIEEVGLCDAVSGGNLIARQVLGTAITITGSEKVVVLWGVVMQ